jgi:DNA repair exonuclease SbcCD ATPase subunit
MRRAVFFILLVFGVPGATFGQAASSDSQTLQALLTEVRELRQDLRISLARIQSAQVLLSRLQTQQAAVTRASERLNDARSKLAEAQTNQKFVAVASRNWRTG